MSGSLNGNQRDFSIGSQAVKPQQNVLHEVKEIFLRALPYWPIVVASLLITLICAFLYIRYKPTVYKVQTRIIVIDDEQSNAGNLLNALQVNDDETKTEKEKEILLSKRLIEQVIVQNQLYSRWSVQGRIRTQELFNNLPITLTVVDPYRIKTEVTGEVKVLDDGLIEFNGKKYAPGVTCNSPMGPIIWKFREGVRDLRTLRTMENVSLNLAVVPVAKLAGRYRGQLAAEPITRGSTILDVSIRETYPDRGVIFLNSLLDVYGKENVAFRNRVYQNTTDFIDKRLRAVADELDNAEGSIQGFKARAGMVDLSLQGQQYLAQLKEIDTRRSEADLQLKVLDKITEYVNNRNLTAQPVPATLGLNDPMLLDLLQQLHKTEFEISRLRTTTGPDNPQLKVLESNLETLRPSILASIRNLRIRLQEEFRTLEAKAGEIESSVSRLPAYERELLDLSRQQQIKNATYTFLLQKREESIISAAAQVSSHRIINAPEVRGQVAPVPNLIYLIAITLGMVLAVALIFFLEFSHGKLLYSQMVSDQTGVPLLGDLSVYSDKVEPFVFRGEQRSLVAEQLRSLRSNLSYFKPKGLKSYVILVTSSISGEGKSFVSLNVAGILAKANKKVLLIELDLRRPSLSARLGLKSRKGISDYFLGKAGIEDLIKPIEEVPNLFFLSSGPIPPNPVELILNGRLAELIAEARKEFDYILIDSPPVGLVTDAKDIAPVVDITLYISRYRFTPVEVLPLITNLNESKVFPNLCLVFNGVSPKALSKYGYSYGYGYGYGRDVSYYKVS